MYYSDNRGHRKLVSLSHLTYLVQLSYLGNVRTMKIISLKYDFFFKIKQNMMMIFYAIYYNDTLFHLFVI